MVFESESSVCMPPTVEMCFLCLQQQLPAKGTAFWGCPCVIIKCLWAGYLTNRLWEFHQVFYNLGAVGNKDELIRFWGQKVKDQGHNKTKYGQKCLIQKAPFHWRHDTGWWFSVEDRLIWKTLCVTLTFEPMTLQTLSVLHAPDNSSCDEFN